MNTYRLDVTYIGANYSGWQIQPNGPSIQEELERALNILCRNESIRVIGSGRTDAGVHALNQVAHFKSDTVLNLETIIPRLNGLLPRDIRVKAIALAEETFHAQISAKKKTYRYQIYRNQVLDPFHAPYHWHLHDKLSIEAIRLTTTFFIGTHDFTSFANQSRFGAAAKNGVRTLFELNVLDKGDHLYFEFIGNGFLYKMVRNIVGTLVDVGRGKIDPTEIPKLLEQKDRRLLSQAAPAHGLFLVSVDYSATKKSIKLE